MKKTILIALLAFLCLSVKAQIKDTIPVVNGHYEYAGIVKLDSSYKKDDIYKSAKVYFVDNFKSANDVLQYQDQSEGKIIGKGFFEIHASIMGTDIKWNVYYTTSIECKDGKYRWRIYDITIHQLMYSPGGNNTGDENLTIAEAIIKTQKGWYKKPTIRLINQMIDAFNETPLVIKKYISNGHVSKSDF